MRNLNEEKITVELSKQKWEHMYFFANDPNAMWDMWKRVFLKLLDKHAPLQHKKLRSKKVPWITSNIKKLIVQRNKLKRKVILTNLDCKKTIGQIIKQAEMKSI